jgi:hypothetical protein
VLFIYSAKACLRGKTPPRLGHLAPAFEVTGEKADHDLFKMVRYVLLPPLRPLPAKTRFCHLDEQAKELIHYACLEVVP